MSHKLLEERSERHFDLGENEVHKYKESDLHEYRSEYGCEVKHHQH